MQVPTYISLEEVMFFDTDIGGVVHNLAYLRMIEKNRTKLAGLLGLDLKSMAQTGVFPVVVRTEVDYFNAGSLSDVLRIEGTLSEVQGARFWCDFSVFRQGSEDLLLVKCRQVLALVQMPGGRPLRLPADWKRFRKA